MKLTSSYKPNPAPPLDKITIEITPQEAVYLRTVLNRIGGACPARDFFDAINRRLLELDVKEDSSLVTSGHQGIYLKSPSA